MGLGWYLGRDVCVYLVGICANGFLSAGQWLSYRGLAGSRKRQSDVSYRPFLRLNKSVLINVSGQEIL